MSSSSSSETQLLKYYRGNCHCGSFIFTLLVPEIVSAESCNCSICRKKGYLWVIPDTTKGHKFEVVKDEGKLTEYVTGPRGTKHNFCSECGTGVYALCEKEEEESGKGIWVNVKAIQELKIWDLEVKEFDGKSIGPPYQPARFDGPEPTAKVENGAVYHGSCHCGAVKVAVKTKGPLDKTYQEKVMECNCSICQRGGYIWIYPTSPDQISLSEGSKENLTSYACLQKVMSKTFCKTCGVPLTNVANELMTEERIRASCDDPEMVLRWRNVVWPINVRCLDRCASDESWEWDEKVKELTVERVDGWGMVKPGYVNP
ncbi:Mss4-like protein [Pseudoneurospora amorphoporcata]|uniref:Mss4-like protein n=1 Tax=Pseudoneurospora amorphoporcata TaxID=241081 RepID=A0AAN6P0G1_9PEZI|nr:Mss4-like protein [Pseudoneurospora amorphoporcata]